MPYRWNVAFVNWWCDVELGAFAWLIGVKTVVRGEENIPEGACIVASKHQAMWETLFLHRHFRNPALILKRELMWVPIFGWWIAKMRMIPIDRGAHAAALRKMLRSAKERADAGRPIAIFPQGTRTPPGTQNTYKPGVAAIYGAIDVPVVPVALNSGLCWPKKGYAYKPGIITVEFLAPIAPGLPRKEFMAELEARIETATDKLVAEAT